MCDAAHPLGKLPDRCGCGCGRCCSCEVAGWRAKPVLAQLFDFCGSAAKVADTDGWALSSWVRTAGPEMCGRGAVIGR